MYRQKGIIAAATTPLLLLILFSSCGFLGTKSDEAGEDANIRAHLNGIPWVAEGKFVDVTTHVGRRHFLSASRKNEYGRDIHGLSLNVDYGGPGTYRSFDPFKESGARSFFVEQDHDAGVAWFRLVEGEENVLEVTSHDEDARIIEGTFSGTFAFESGLPVGHPLRSLPDTIRLTEGYFRVPIYP
jgi:hypothetical protein